MKKAFIAIIAVVAMLAASAPAFAHGNETHVMGVVKSVNGDKVTVTTSKGDITVALDSKTTITRGDETATRDDLKVGERVVIHAKKEKGELIATAVKLAPKSAATSASAAHQH